MYGYQRWNLFDFFLHKTSKIFILCQIRYPEETSKGAGLIRRALLTLTHASNMLGNFQSSVKGFIILTPRNGSLSSVLKSPLWNSPAYLGRFNWDGNVVDNTFPPSPWDALMWKVSCFFFGIKYLWYQICQMCWHRWHSSGLELLCAEVCSKNYSPLLLLPYFEQFFSGSSLLFG